MRIVCYSTRRLSPRTSTKHLPSALLAMPTQPINTTHVCDPSPLHDELTTPPNPQSNQMHPPTPSTSTTPSRQQQDHALRRCRAAQLVQVACTLPRRVQPRQSATQQQAHASNLTRKARQSCIGAWGHRACSAGQQRPHARSVVATGSWCKCPTPPHKANPPVNEPTKQQQAHAPGRGGTGQLVQVSPTWTHNTPAPHNQHNSRGLMHPGVGVPGSWCKCPATLHPPLLVPAPASCDHKKSRLLPQQHEPQRQRSHASWRGGNGQLVQVS
jgi:hypothetical protein